MSCLNIPSICFGQIQKADKSNAFKKFEILKKAKIYFDKEDDLINHINNT